MTSKCGIRGAFLHVSMAVLLGAGIGVAAASAAPILDRLENAARTGQIWNPLVDLCIQAHVPDVRNDTLEAMYDVREVYLEERRAILDALARFDALTRFGIDLSTDMDAAILSVGEHLYENHEAVTVEHLGRPGSVKVEQLAKLLHLTTTAASTPGFDMVGRVYVAGRDRAVSLRVRRVPGAVGLCEVALHDAVLVDILRKGLATSEGGPANPRSSFIQYRISTTIELTFANSIRQFDTESRVVLMDSTGLGLPPRAGDVLGRIMVQITEKPRGYAICAEPSFLDALAALRSDGWTIAQTLTDPQRDALAWTRAITYIQGDDGGWTPEELLALQRQAAPGLLRRVDTDTTRSRVLTRGDEAMTLTETVTAPNRVERQCRFATETPIDAPAIDTTGWPNAPMLADLTYIFEEETE